jgi:hypothetical protein
MGIRGLLASPGLCSLLLLGDLADSAGAAAPRILSTRQAKWLPRRIEFREVARPKGASGALVGRIYGRHGNYLNFRVALGRDPERGGSRTPGPSTGRWTPVSSSPTIRWFGLTTTWSLTPGFAPATASTKPERWSSKSKRSSAALPPAGPAPSRPISPLPTPLDGDSLAAFESPDRPPPPTDRLEVRSPHPTEPPTSPPLKAPHPFQPSAPTSLLTPSSEVKLTPDTHNRGGAGSASPRSVRALWAARSVRRARP